MSATESHISEPETLDESSQPLDRPAEANSVAEEEPQKSVQDPNSVSENGGERESKENKEEEEDDDDEGEEGECGFCLFMKGGGCKESFISWEKCIEEAEKNKEDIVEKCFEVTGALKKCMEAHPDYYEPVLRAEKAAEAEAVKELEKESAADNAAVMAENTAVAVTENKEVPSSAAAMAENTAAVVTEKKEVPNSAAMAENTKEVPNSD